jgi:hypothetical protein
MEDIMVLWGELDRTVCNVLYLELGFIILVRALSIKIDFSCYFTILVFNYNKPDDFIYLRLYNGCQTI